MCAFPTTTKNPHYAHGAMHETMPQYIHDSLSLSLSLFFVFFLNIILVSHIKVLFLKKVYSS